jgi:hypothetical protein
MYCIRVCIMCIFSAHYQRLPLHQKVSTYSKVANANAYHLGKVPNYQEWGCELSAEGKGGENLCDRRKLYFSLIFSASGSQLGK